MHTARSVKILLVEDNPGDVVLTQEAMRRSKVIDSNDMMVVPDGEEAIACLRKEGPYATAPSPDLVLLDLNLPKKKGQEVLAEIRSDPALTHLPVVVLTSSDTETDIVRSYRLHVNAYVRKPFDFAQFDAVVHAISSFWFEVVSLPSLPN